MLVPVLSCGAGAAADDWRIFVGANQRLKLTSDGTWVFVGVFSSCTAFFQLQLNKLLQQSKTASADSVNLSSIAFLIKNACGLYNYFCTAFSKMPNVKLIV